MAFKEFFIDVHKKAVILIEKDYAVIISDLYPCKINVSDTAGEGIEIENIKVIYRDIEVPKPFSKGKLEIACIRDDCFATNIILFLPHEHLSQNGFEVIVNEVKNVLRMYEQCLNREHP